MELSINTIRQLFEQQVSYLVFDALTLQIWIHLPLTSPVSQLELYILHNAPLFVPLSDTGKALDGQETKRTFWNIQTGDTLLAISSEGTNLYEVPLNSLQLCNKLGNQYYCKDSLVRKRLNPSSTCLGSLFCGLS